MSEIEVYRCKDCGYTPRDAAIHLDHQLCVNRGGQPMPEPYELAGTGTWKIGIPQPKVEGVSWTVYKATGIDKLDQLFMSKEEANAALGFTGEDQ